MTNFTPLQSWAQIETLATMRESSIFLEDFAKDRLSLTNHLQNATIAVIGAAGSIGSEVVAQLSHFPIKTLVLYDISENNLVEVTRNFRCNPKSNKDIDIEVYPIGLGDPEFKGSFSQYQFDFVLNFSAMKHVRSEKDVHCLKRLLRTNVFSFHDLFEGLGSQCKRVFSVSSDKAVNPANLMGASKNLMEQVLLYHSSDISTGSARFANVSFSSGSLPDGFLKRIANRQPLAAPNDVRRYFISHQEAAELSILSAFTGDNTDVFFPNPSSDLPEVGFHEIATRLLEQLGFTPYLVSDETEALQKMDELLEKKMWPCLFSSSNTTGEKHLEEFVGPDDRLNTSSSFNAIGVCKTQFSSAQKDQLLQFLQSPQNKDWESLTKADLVEKMQVVVPQMNHIEMNSNLDSKM